MNRQTWVAVLAALSVLAAARAAAQPAPQRVTVTDISILGNTLLPQASIDAAVASFKGQRTMDEIKQAAQAVQQLYRQAGYGGVVTFLPEQAVAGGKLVIGVLEGRLARVVVLGNKQFSAENVRRSVPQLAEGQTPRVRRIDVQVQLANDNPARKLALTLEPGSQRGEVDAQIQVSEEPVSRWSLMTDNTGSRQTGRLRLGLGYQNAALWDRDHQLSLQAQTSPEHPSRVQIYSGSYRVPLYDAGLLLNGYATYSNTDAGPTATAAGALQFVGKGRSLGLSVTRLLERWGEFDQRMSLAIERRDYLNDCAIQGLPAGACGSAGESVTVHPLTLDYTALRSGERAAGVYAAVSHNLALGGARANNIDAVRPGARRGYTLLRGGGSLAVPLRDDWRMNYRLNLQTSADALVPGEQFGLAGASVVRGYEEREVTGDSGLAASAELVSPAMGRSGWRMLAFADGGVARNRLNTECLEGQTRCTLASVGLGARLALGSSQWRVDLAQALKDGRTTERHAMRLHFQASLTLP